MITYDFSLKTFFPTKINDDRFLSGFGTKELGNGREVSNIFNFLTKNQITFQKIVVLGQIHSANIEHFISNIDNILPGFNHDLIKVNETPIKIDDTDGVFTDNKLVVLTVQTADCLPIVFVDKSSGLIGISHQGWRGSLKKLPQKMIEKMVENGAKKESIIVAIGPGIGQCCYDIDDDHYYTFLEDFDGYSDKIFQAIKGRKHLNLALLNYLLLIDAGIKKENMEFFPFCTSCDKERFFSFRRDKKSHKEMFSFVLKLK